MLAVQLWSTPKRLCTVMMAAVAARGRGEGKAWLGLGEGRRVDAREAAVTVITAGKTAAARTAAAVVEGHRAGRGENVRAKTTVAVTGMWKLRRAGERR